MNLKALLILLIAIVIRSADLSFAQAEKDSNIRK